MTESYPIANCSLRVRRRGLSNRVARVGGALIAIGLIVGAIQVFSHAATPTIEATFLASWIVCVGTIVIVAGLRLLPWPFYRRVTLLVSDRGLEVKRAAGPVHFARDEFTSGVARPREGLDEVQLETRGGAELQVLLPKGQASAMLDALGLGSETHRGIIRLGSSLRPLWMTAILFPAVAYLSYVLIGIVLMLLGPRFVSPVVLLVPWAAFSLVATVVLVRLGYPVEATIGTEGVRLQLAFRTRYLRYSEVADVCVHSRCLVLLLRGGRALWIARVGTRDEPQVRAEILQHGGQKPGPELAKSWLSRVLMSRAPGHLAAAFAGRTLQAMHAFERRERAELSELLRRAGRPTSAWRAAISETMHTGPRYRVHVPGQQELARVLNDAAASGEERLGASFALVQLGDAGRALVQQASEACADEDLRGALASVARGDEQNGLIERVIAGHGARS